MRGSVVTRRSLASAAGAADGRSVPSCQGPGLGRGRRGAGMGREGRAQHGKGPHPYSLEKFAPPPSTPPACPARPHFLRSTRPPGSEQMAPATFLEGPEEDASLPPRAPAVSLSHPPPMLLRNPGPSSPPRSAVPRAPTPSRRGGVTSARTVPPRERLPPCTCTPNSNTATLPHSSEG